MHIPLLFKCKVVKEINVKYGEKGAAEVKKTSTLCPIIFFKALFFDILTSWPSRAATHASEASQMAVRS